MAFTLLSYAMESVTGRNYSQLLHDEIITPLNLTNTGFSGSGNDSKAVIPPSEENSWGSDYADQVPGGGLYSSSNDISKLLGDIISPQPKLLTRAQVKAWLKPHSMTSNMNMLVGLPWEIFRTRHLTPDYPHAIDLFTKSGTAVGYQGGITIIEQYGVGIVVLTAGARGAEAQLALERMLLGTLMPIVEEATREQAQTYTGNYSTPESAEVKGSISLGIDSGTGLRLLELSRNGSDILEALRTMWSSQVVYLGELVKDLRLYPTDVVKTIEGPGGTKNIEEEWRLQYDSEFEVGESDLPSWDELGQPCLGWMASNSIVYAGEPVDRFVFVRDGIDGQFLEVRVPSLRLNLTIHL